jgi:uncharacterized membrane protein
MSKTRVEACSDAVIAVAITLLALDLRVPEPNAPGTLAHRLGQQWPNYAAFVISFLTIGIIWINHHATLRRLRSVDHTILILNLLLLLTICILPFSTALIAEYLRADSGQHLAAAVYGGSFVLLSSAFFALQRHLLVTKAHLLREDVTTEARRALRRRNATGLVPYLAASVCGLLSPYLTLAICGGVGVFYAWPTTMGEARVSSSEMG